MTKVEEEIVSKIMVDVSKELYEWPDRAYHRRFLHDVERILSSAESLEEIYRLTKTITEALQPKSLQR